MQGSVISSILCNMYTSDAMVEVKGNHAEHADESCLWDSNSSLGKEYVMRKKTSEKLRNDV